MYFCVFSLSTKLYKYTFQNFCTVDSKIIQALEIVHVQKLIPNAVLLNKYRQVVIFSVYTLYNKHEMIKIGNQTREKSQVLSPSTRIILLPTVPHYSVEASSEAMEALNP